MMSKVQARPPLVSSFAIAFKRAAGLVEDVAEAKKEHRQNLSTLVTKYMEDVTTGKAEGIRNAKELVEVIKTDMLLLGEATERKDDSTVDEIRIRKVSQVLDEMAAANGDVNTLITTMLMAMNNVNDAQDTNPTKRMDVNVVEVVEGIVDIVDCASPEGGQPTQL